MSDRIAVMHAGKVEQLGDPGGALRTPDDRFVADFIGSTNLLHGRVERDGRVRLDSGDVARVAHDGIADGTRWRSASGLKSIALVPAAPRSDPGDRRAGRLPRFDDLLSTPDGRRTRPDRPLTEGRDPPPGRQRRGRQLVAVRGAGPRRPARPSRPTWRRPLMTDRQDTDSPRRGGRARPLPDRAADDPARPPRADRCRRGARRPGADRRGLLVRWGPSVAPSATLRRPPRDPVRRGQRPRLRPRPPRRRPCPPPKRS